MSSIYVVMPAYNEEANIEATVKDWYSIVAKGAGSRLVIADSGSTDSTHKILLALKKKYPKIEILSKTGQYHGPKVIALYKYAIKKKADWVFQTDSDGQTNPAEFRHFGKRAQNTMQLSVIVRSEAMVKIGPLWSGSFVDC